MKKKLEGEEKREDQRRIKKEKIEKGKEKDKLG